MVPRSGRRAADAGPSGIAVHDGVDRSAFQDHVLAHLDAGYNLALWMLRDEHQAGDALQDASLKAWGRFASFRGGDGKSWFLAIVRTSAIDLARRARRHAPAPIDEESESVAGSAADSQPLSGILRREHAAVVHEVVWSLPEPMREILVLREVEGLSYAQIAQVLDAPIGTVMSRISRARDAAETALRGRLMKEPIDGL
jgi:RNA polymerase sigma-70 factor (ECF subfamily)